MSRQWLAGAVVAAVGCAAAAVAMGAGGIGDGGTISSCYNASEKGWRPIANGASCKQTETLLSWSISGPSGPSGPPGEDGVSPTVEQLSPGDANCPAGGAAITDAAGTTAYVCSGHDGAQGADGEPFSGTFTSPNGQYSISIADTGITLKRGTSEITLQGGEIRIKSTTATKIETGSDLDVKTSSNASIVASGAATIKSSGTLSVSGSTVDVNGAGCHPAARLGDSVSPTQITAGSTTVCIGG